MNPWVSGLLLVALLSGCAVEKRVLRASMPDDELRTTVNQHFHAGMDEAQVRNELGDLRVRDENIRVYGPQEAGPRVVLARVWPAGGRWMDDATYTLPWIDLSFVFGTSDGGLVDVRMHRDALVFGEDGTYLSGPARHSVGGGRTREWPSSVPFPKDPLEGAESVLNMASSMYHGVEFVALAQAQGSAPATTSVDAIAPNAIVWGR